MTTRGRKAGFHMGPEHRNKISKSRILGNLIRYAEGEANCDIDYQRAQIGLGLLKKVMPDLTENMIKGSEQDGSIGVTFKTILEK